MKCRAGDLLDRNSGTSSLIGFAWGRLDLLGVDRECNCCSEADLDICQVSTLDTM